MHGTHSSASPRGTPYRRGKSPNFRAESPSEASSSLLPSNFTKEHHPTFTSSLKILVEGARPIESDSDKDHSQPAPQQATPGESRRTPRKSKTDALATHARSSSPEGGDDDNTIDVDKYRIPVAPTLDLSSVKTTSSRQTKIEGGESRPFGLQDCPEYYPTTEEFKDPMAYVRSISEEAKNYGICKIIPPAEWKMPFVTDTELYRYHKQQGSARVVVPIINHKPLDLWLLRKEVHKLGGYDTKPSRLSSTLINADDTSPPSSPLTDTSGPLSEAPEDRETRDADGNRISRPRRSTRMSSIEQTSPKKPISVSFPVVPPPIFYDKPKVDPTKGTPEIRTSSFPHRTPITSRDQQNCEVCHKKNRGEEMLLAMAAIVPPLTVIPKDHWFCFTCLSGTGGDFGFDEGEEHSLSSFQARDKEFRRRWWKEHVPEPTEPYQANDPKVNMIGDVQASEYDVEKEIIIYLILAAAQCRLWRLIHWGETKTWYGIPGNDAEKFDAATKCEAPDLFEAQPDLLFQLVTLMNPKRASIVGNHGFNFNEAVNFTLPDWLSYGRDCVARYREHRKLPVFSHDELLVTITQQSHSIKTATWLYKSLEEMTEWELASRAKARTVGLPEVLEEEDRLDDQYQCTICKTFCYLSFVRCSCTLNVVCVDHADLLCEDRPAHQLTLRKRFSDKELTETQVKSTERANAPSSWRGKLSKVLFESNRSHVRHLKALLAEGDRISYPLPELNSLRKCVNKANEWIDAANTFTVRKQSRKRSRRPRAHSSISDPVLLDGPGDRPGRSLDEFYALSREVEDLGFDAPKITTLDLLAREAEVIKERAQKLLQSQPAEENRESFLQDCKNLLADGSSINVILDELLEVEKIVDRQQLMKDLQEKLDDNDIPLTLEEVRHFLLRARACGVSSEHKHIRVLETRQRAGNNWEDRAQSILSQPVKTIEELEDFADLDPMIPMDPGLLARLVAARAKAKDFDKQARAWLEPEPDAPKPKVLDVLRMVKSRGKRFQHPFHRGS
ncbi:hypothetical protein DXG01_004021 [Tephrocybe rancida]|nr:hypothetical protein DXG01_004021 [Tephrocybe rancida]